MQRLERRAEKKARCRGGGREATRYRVPRFIALLFKFQCAGVRARRIPYRLEMGFPCGCKKKPKRRKQPAQAKGKVKKVVYWGEGRRLS